MPAITVIASLGNVCRTEQLTKTTLVTTIVAYNNQAYGFVANMNAVNIDYLVNIDNGLWRLAPIT